jgi:hypothetical protein
VLWLALVILFGAKTALRPVDHVLELRVRIHRLGARIKLLADLRRDAHLLHYPVALLTLDDALNVASHMLVPRSDDKSCGFGANHLVLLDRELNRPHTAHVSALAHPFREALVRGAVVRL